MIEEARTHPLRDVRGQATFALATYDRHRAADPPEPDQGSVTTTDEVRTRLASEAERLFSEVVKKFADVPSSDGNGTIGAKAEAELTRLRNLPNLKVGRPAPEIVGVDLDGKPLRLSDHRGKVVVLVFWDFWSSAFAEMAPQRQKLAKRFDGRPFALVGVNADVPSDLDKARLVANREELPWRSFRDGEPQGPIQTAYDVEYPAKVYVIDALGIIRAIDVTGEALDEIVDKLMGEVALDPKKDKP